MEVPFSWQRFERIARILESMGYLIAVFGPLLGVGMLVLGGGVIRVAGVGVIFGSILAAAYHIGFSMLMNAVRDVTKHLDTMELEHAPHEPSVPA